MTLDDCDIPEVQALYEYNSDSKFLDRAPAALEALYERVKELEAERDLAIDMYGPKGEHDKTLAHIRSILEAHSADPDP